MTETLERTVSHSSVIAFNGALEGDANTNHPKNCSSSLIATLSSSSSSSSIVVPNRHEYLLLDAHYQPNSSDVIVHDVTGKMVESNHYHPNVYFEECLQAMVSQYQEHWMHQRYDHLYPMIQTLIASTKTQGGQFLRRTKFSSSSSKDCGWVRVSPILAQMYTYHRINYVMNQRLLALSSSMTSETEGMYDSNFIFGEKQ
jgi:hypothetical protein